MAIIDSTHPAIKSSVKGYVDICALDAQTESEILGTLKTLLPGRTTLSITHRLNLASTADWIIVLQDGQIVEQGTHAQLLKNGGLYR